MQGLENGFEVLAWDAQRTLPTDVDHPLFLEFVDHVLEAFRDVTPVPLLRLLLRWEPRAADRWVMDNVVFEGVFRRGRPSVRGVWDQWDTLSGSGVHADRKNDGSVTVSEPI